MPRRLTAVAIEPVAAVAIEPVAFEPRRNTGVRPAAPPMVDTAKLRTWLLDLSPPSTRTVITAAVAGVSLVAGITIAMTLG